WAGGSSRDPCSTIRVRLTSTPRCSRSLTAATGSTTRARGAPCSRSSAGSFGLEAELRAREEDPLHLELTAQQEHVGPLAGLEAADLARDPGQLGRRQARHAHRLGKRG